jgi:hypothetical protein
VEASLRCQWFTLPTRSYWDRLTLKGFPTRPPSGRHIGAHTSRAELRRTATAAGRDVIVSIPEWAEFAGLAEDHRSIAAARWLIDTGQGPKVAKVGQRRGVRLQDHARWARSQPWAKYLAASAAAEREKRERNNLTHQSEGANNEKARAADTCAGFKNLSPDGYTNDSGDERGMRYHGASPNRNRSPKGRSVVEGRTLSALK